MAMDADTFKQLLDTVERFVREKLVPAEARIAEEDRIPDEIRQGIDRKSTRLNSSHVSESRMPSSA